MHLEKRFVVGYLFWWYTVCGYNKECFLFICAILMNNYFYIYLSQQLAFICCTLSVKTYSQVGFLCGLGVSWGFRRALPHLVFKQEELHHRFNELHHSVFHWFLQQVPFCLNLCVFIPCHCLHGRLQEPQAHQHRALGVRKGKKWGERVVKQLPLESIIKDPNCSGNWWIYIDVPVNIRP